jgi:predicted glycosyltransferase
MGLSKNKCQKYPGIKEELYVRSFAPTPDFRAKFLAGHNCQHARDKTLAVVRPPATTANYHSAKSENLFDNVLHLLLNAPNVFTVIVPRTNDQKTAIRTQIENMPDVLPRVLILEEAVNGLDLAFASDLLISGGGTMNREAVLLGIPVYSIFAGQQGSLDRQMESDGLITFIRDARDLSKIRLERREPQAPKSLTDRVERFVIDQIDAFLTKN